MNRRRALLGLTLPAAMLAGCAGAPTTDGTPISGPRGASRMRPDGTREFRDHELVDQDGRTLRFQSDLIEGRVFAATFMYVHCTGICRDLVSKMRGAHELLTPVMGDPVRFYSFSLASDTPADMKDYMRTHGLDRLAGWSFLSGSREAITDIRWAFGFSEPNEELDQRLDGHTGMARFGNHPTDTWAACPALGTPRSIARAMARVLPRDKRALVASLEHEPGRPARRDRSL